MTLKDKVQQQTDAWVKDNTDFDKDNDPDDSKWNKINAYVSACSHHLPNRKM